VKLKKDTLKVMHKIQAYRAAENYATLAPLGVKRDWMEQTHERHAYTCFPVTLTNGMGWSLSFPEDITFVWDGKSDSSKDHVKILAGHKYCYTERANATISFKTGLTFKTEDNVSLLGMPAPNYFIDGAQPFTTVISTSFFTAEFPVAWRITKPYTPITIPAGYPVISLLPISLKNLQDSEIDIIPIKDMPRSQYADQYNQTDHIKFVSKVAEEGKWTNFYRDAVDYMGNKLGQHEVKSLKLKVNGGDNA
jgi:hypothetical protein